METKPIEASLEVRQLKQELADTMEHQHRIVGMTTENTKRADDVLRTIRAVLDRVDEGRKE